MTRRISVVCIIFGVTNILLAFVPLIVNGCGLFYVLAEPPLPLENNVDIGPPIWQKLKADFPGYKPEVITSSACTALMSLLLLVGSIGLFLNHDWARIVCIGVAILMTCTYCVHDIYQLFFVRPVLLEALVRNLPAGQPGEAEGAQIGFAFFWFFWCWINPLISIYMLAMATTLALTRMLGQAKPDLADERPRRRAWDRDERFEELA